MLFSSKIFIFRKIISKKFSGKFCRRSYRNFVIILRKVWENLMKIFNKCYDIVDILEKIVSKIWWILNNPYQNFKRNFTKIFRKFWKKFGMLRKCQVNCKDPNFKNLPKFTQSIHIYCQWYCVTRNFALLQGVTVWRTEVPPSHTIQIFGSSWQ